MNLRESETFLLLLIVSTAITFMAIDRLLAGKVVYQVPSEGPIIIVERPLTLQEIFLYSFIVVSYIVAVITLSILYIRQRMKIKKEI